MQHNWLEFIRKKGFYPRVLGGAVGMRLIEK